ncbi:hypothetical protein QTG54_006997 [Skeletonema marinoi]|uniref:Uncharacterized protein n=1 Tax=Skeletonema marinoi TaxID=267567 RepID=A0AAD8YBK0_9STRA|nr:hypothetical protein QTG54_006997 [Skeletonema marinoi]
MICPSSLPPSHHFPTRYPLPLELAHQSYLNWQPPSLQSHEVAKDCVPAEVLAAYLDGSNQKKWNEDKVLDINISRTGSGLYRQDMVLKPQRVLTGKTTIMRYTQKICVDKIGNSNYNAFVELDTKSKSNTKLRPFHILKVNVGIEQVGNDVHIYAAGIMKVNRKIVPNLVIFARAAGRKVARALGVYV